MKKSEMYERFVNEFELSLEVLQDFKNDGDEHMFTYAQGNLKGMVDLASDLKIINDKEWCHFTNRYTSIAYSK